MKWRATQQINQNININSNIGCAKKLGKIQPKLLDNRFRQFLRWFNKRGKFNKPQTTSGKETDGRQSVRWIRDRKK